MRKNESASSARNLVLWQLFFDHGIETLVAPIFGPELLTRGADYHALLAGMLEPGLRFLYEDVAVRDCKVHPRCFQLVSYAHGRHSARR